MKAGASIVPIVISTLCLMTVTAESVTTHVKADRAVLSRELKSEPDWKLSPYTGWTRDHWIEVAGKLAAGFVQYMNPETGMPEGYQDFISLPYNPNGSQSAKDECFLGFGRSMTIVAAYTAATGKSTYPGYPGDLAKPYLTGIIRGTDPDDPCYWTGMNDHSTFGNAIVISLLTSPEFFWDPLTHRQKLNLARWLKQLTDRKSYDNNHYYFHMCPVKFLDMMGVDYDREKLEIYYQRLFGFYRGDGWYVDGDNQGFEYYSTWGWHLFNLLLYDSDPKWREKYGKRIVNYAKEFYRNFPYFFGSDGSPVAWGRSLHYRFANLSGLGWAQRTGVNPLDAGLTRRLASGCLKYFWENGCMSEHGLLEPGYLGRNDAQPEGYNLRLQPYWAGTGLIFLALPEDDPFWSAQEKPLPVEIDSEVRVIRGAQMVVRVDATTGESRVYKIGDPFDFYDRYQRNAKYFGHAYSSQIGFALTGEGSPKLAANSSGASSDGKTWSYRANPRPRMISEFENVSEYTLNDSITGLPGTVITHTFIGRHGEVHVVYHTAEKPLYLSVGGYGIQVAEGEKAVRSGGEAEIMATAGRKRSYMRVLGGVEGSLEMRTVQPRPEFGHAHLFGGGSAFPVWTSNSPVPRCHPVILYVNAAKGALPGEKVAAEMPGPTQMRLVFKDRETFLTTLNNYWAE